MRYNLVCAHAVLRALEIAGRRTRVLNRGDRFGRYGDTPRHLLHVEVIIARTEPELDQLLDGVWDLLRAVLEEHGAPDADATIAACDAYTRMLITQREPYRLDTLGAYLSHANA